ncbi:MAG: MASE1 domain-containing protein [Elusimicrobia bacterium]|nr:MASE1 domain-containing protein [Elusimicrobiota bacterium]
MRLSRLPAFLGLVSAYFMAGKMGLALAQIHPSASVVWPPSGISLAALILLGTEMWPAVFAGAFLVNITTAGDLLTSLGIASGNALEAVIGCLLVRRLAGGPNCFDHPTSIFKFTFSAALCAVASATMGVGSLSLRGYAPWPQFGSICLTWWLGDMTGMLLITPCLILWALAPRIQWGRREAAEGLALLSLLGLACKIVFGAWYPWSSAPAPLTFLCLPPLIWISCRFSPRDTATACLAMACAALYGTIKGRGAFGLAGPYALPLLQAFLAVCSQMALILSASLHSIQDRFRLMVDEVGDYAIFILDPEGRVTSWNRGAQRINGYAPEEIIGRDYACLFTPESRENGRPRANLELAAAQGHLHEEDWRVRKGGIRFWAKASMTALKGQDGALKGFLKVVQDMSQRKLAEDLLEKKSQELSRANAELNLYASMVSHELQEPLRKILTFGDMLKSRSEGLDEESRHHVGRMQDSAHRMARLVEDILGLARITTRTRPLVPVDLGAVLKDAAGNFEALVSSAGGSIEVAAGMPAVQADESLLRQLFYNLFSNSWKFRKKNEPLRIAVSCRRPSAGFVEITVEDNGIGFDERYLDKIFQPFQRLHPKEAYPGSGMGLAISERILLRHGGAITAKSRPGEGSRFIVTLPV